jgi:peptidoglycan/LPS O-acetylase OafA/YrhL
VIGPHQPADFRTGAISAALYFNNWWSIFHDVSYFARFAPISPLNHLWSLSVEEQFYIVWPLLILVLVWWHGRRGRSLGRTLMAGLALIAIPSLAWSVYLTHAVPGRAYFVTTTRLWELALGAALAIAAARLARLPRLASMLMGWTGLAAIAAAALMYDGTTPFPGYHALLPTLGAAAVIAAGVAHSSSGAGRLLGIAPMTDIGALSYSLYLWHWPLLVAATAVFGELSPTLGVLVAGFSVVPAWLSYRVVEYPIHHSRPLAMRPRRTFLVGALATSTGVVAAFVPAAAHPDYEVAADAPGATVLGDRPANDPDSIPVDRVAALTPDPLTVRDDNPRLYEEGCHQDQRGSTPLWCTFGDADSDFVVALVGDSHAGQWQPALAEVAQAQGWRLDTSTKSSCGLFDVSVTLGGEDRSYASCAEWNDRLTDQLTGSHRPDLVIVSSSNNYKVVSDGVALSTSESRPYLTDGFRRSWDALRDAGIPVVVIRDTPRLDIDVPECVSANVDKLTTCVSPKAPAVERGGDAEVRAATEVSGVHVIDLTEAICPGSTCPAVIGDVIVWRDTNHITATYSRSLAPRLGAALADIL